MQLLMRSAALVLALLLSAATAMAAPAPKSFAVLPFKVNGPAGYKYLERAIPEMLVSRLYWKDNFHPVSKDAAAKITPPESETQAKAAQASLGADYAVWGSVTVVGEDCSLDVRVRDRDGKEWPQSANAKVAGLIPALKGVADSINAEVFKRPGEGGAANATPKMVNQMNPELVHNETQPQQVYLNPQFRYAGAPEGDSRIRSQSLPYSAIGIIVEDLDGDGKNEILMLDDHVVYAYRWDGGRLIPMGEYRSPGMVECLNIRTIDWNRDGLKEIVVSAYNDKGEPESFILNWKGGQFIELMRRVRFYLNVEKLPPDYIPTLIGQRGDNPRLFKPGVHEMMKSGDELVMGKRLDLPEGANVFNFAYLPGGKGEGDKCVILTENERLRVHTERGARLAETDETYSGSAKGMPEEPGMPGLGKDRVQLKNMYFVPLRMYAVNFDRDDNWELLVNRPISTASQFFDRYRFFPQGEIHAMYWDGVGLNLQWKTRRIKGSVADFTVGDFNNDGTTDIVLCVNTHPGALGLESRKTMLLAYPLDLAKADPNTAPDKTENEQQ